MHATRPGLAAVVPILPSKVALAVGQTITVTAQTEQTIAGMVTPRSALHKQASGDTAVWVHDQAEHFAPRVVRHQVLDARHVVITSGLRDGDRVVTEGANLLHFEVLLLMLKN